jgi:hypothetical protein
MATEGHKCGQGKDCQQKRKVEIDKELEEIRAEMEKLRLRMQQGSQVRWRYEWPMKQREKWHVQQLLFRRQQWILRRWLREVETLSDMEEMVFICELEVGEKLSDKERRLVQDLIDCHESSEELSNF